MLVAVVLLVLLLVLALLPEIPTPRILYHFLRLPGPKGVPILGNLLEILSCPRDCLFAYMDKNFEKYNRVFRLYQPGHLLCLLADANDIKMVLKDPLNVDYGIHAKYFKVLAGTGVLVYTGEDRPARRKMLFPIYQVELMEGFVTSLISASQRMNRKVKEICHDNVDVTHLADRFLIEAILESGGAPTDPECADLVAACIEKLGALSLKRVNHPWQLSDLLLVTFGFFDWLSMKMETKRIKTFMGEAVMKADSTVEGGVEVKNNFIHNLLGKAKQQPGLMTFDNIVDEAITFIGSAMDTTSSAMCSMFLCLGLYQDLQERIYEELKEVLPQGEAMTLKKISSLQYLKIFIKEVLRLYPPLGYIPRILSQDLILESGEIVPRGVTVGMFPYLLHRDEKYFPRAQEFDPERFLQDDIDPNTYIPFGAGTKSCLGKKIALLALKIFIINTLREFKIEAVTRREDIKHIPELVLRPNKKIKCKFIPRDK